MKKVLTILAIFAMVALASCSKKDPVQATITASDVTVEEGSTVKINASTNSTAKITFASDNTAVATVAADGTVTGVAAGTANITLKVAAVENAFTAAEKVIKATVTAKPAPEPGPGPEPQTTSITIDGDFSDWAALPAGSFSKTFGDEDATHPALTHCKVYADAEKIYVYFEWDTDMITYEKDVEHVPFHCYINTDGKTDTGGFADQFADACIDVLLEGSLYPDGVMGSYDPGAFSWAGDVNGEGWSWTDLGADSLCSGAGVEGKYELSIDRAGLKDLGFPVADVFSIGFDIQQNWNSVGILPNAAPSEDNASGVVNTLQVTTQK